MRTVYLYKIKINILRASDSEGSDGANRVENQGTEKSGLSGFIVPECRIAFVVLGLQRTNEKTWEQSHTVPKRLLFKKAVDFGLLRLFPEQRAAQRKVFWG